MTGPETKRPTDRFPFGSRMLAASALAASMLATVVVAAMVASGRRRLLRAGAGPAIEGEIEILRPQALVFDTVADERNEPRYNPRLRSVERTTPGPLGPGTTFRAQAVSRGGVVPLTIEITDYARPHRLGSTTRMPGLEVRGTLTFDPTERGTRMRWRWHLEPHGVLALARPLVTWVGSRQERRIWRGLKRYLEEGHADRALQFGP